jgi:hypothetical protein
METNKKEGDVVKTITLSKVTVDHVKDNAFKDDVLSCQLRQTITKTAVYPGKKLSDLSDSLYTVEEFGGENKKFESESIRICWIEVPLDTTTADVEERLSKLPNANIYQIVSIDIDDLLTSSQRHNVEEGILNIATLKSKYALKDKLGKVVKDEFGNQIYRNCYFSSEGKADIINVKSTIEVSIVDNENVA